MQLEESRPKRRKRVDTSPNSKFVIIEAVKQAQLSAERELKLIPVDQTRPNYLV